jgi:hypothetical protein
LDSDTGFSSLTTRCKVLEQSKSSYSAEGLNLILIEIQSSKLGIVFRIEILEFVTAGF